jgi:hypothetical protein
MATEYLAKVLLHQLHRFMWVQDFAARRTAR